MFKDQTLLPVEAVRLAALGLLAERSRKYADLATEIRSFIGLAVGPSLDLMGSSIELLRYEGLATAQGEMLSLTASGQTAPALRDWLDRDLADLNDRIEKFRHGGK